MSLLRDPNYFRTIPESPNQFSRKSVRLTRSFVLNAELRPKRISTETSDINVNSEVTENFKRAVSALWSVQRPD